MARLVCMSARYQQRAAEGVDGGNRVKKAPMIRSFSLNRQTMKRLDLIAKQKNKSVNLLVNDILDKYTRLMNPMNNFGMITIAKADIRYIFEQLPEKILMEVGEKAGETCNLFWFSQLGYPKTLKSVEELMENMCVVGGGGQYNEEERNGMKIISINHMMGMSHSLFLKSFYEKIFASIPDRGNAYTKVETHKDCIIFFQ
jgi:predicted DNA-binding ribbon-helix-helix protein